MSLDRYTHPKIGKIEILLENESRSDLGTKYFALVKSDMSLEYNSSGLRSFGLGNSKKPRSYYYALWGNTPDINSMSVILLASKGYAHLYPRAVKLFFNIVNNSKFVQFSR